MTRKDYIVFAEILKRHRPLADNDGGWDDDKTEADENITSIAEQMCKVFKADNPRFDRIRFLEASGVEI